MQCIHPSCYVFNLCLFAILSSPPILLTQLNRFLGRFGASFFFWQKNCPALKRRRVEGLSSPLFLPEERLGKPYGNGWTAIRCLEYLEATLKSELLQGSETKELNCEPFCGCLVCYPAEQVGWDEQGRSKSFLKVVGWSMGRETRNACSSASLLETNALLRINNQQQEFRSVVSSAQVCIFPQKSKKQYDLYIAACYLQK